MESIQFLLFTLHFFNKFGINLKNFLPFPYARFSIRRHKFLRQFQDPILLGHRSSIQPLIREDIKVTSKGFSPVKILHLLAEHFFQGRCIIVLYVLRRKEKGYSLFLCLFSDPFEDLRMFLQLLRITVFEFLIF
jgi:hypothetical protein